LKGRANVGTHKFCSRTEHYRNHMKTRAVILLINVMIVLTGCSSYKVNNFGSRQRFGSDSSQQINFYHYVNDSLGINLKLWNSKKYVLTFKHSLKLSYRDRKALKDSKTEFTDHGKLQALFAGYEWMGYEISKADNTTAKLGNEKAVYTNMFCFFLEEGTVKPDVSWTNLGFEKSLRGFYSRSSIDRRKLKIEEIIPIRAGYIFYFFITSKDASTMSNTFIKKYEHIETEAEDSVLKYSRF